MKSWAEGVLAHDPGVGVADFFYRVCRQAKQVGIPLLRIRVRVAHAIAELYLATAASLAEIEINPLRVVVEADRTSCVALDIVALRR